MYPLLVIRCQNFRVARPWRPLCFSQILLAIPPFYSQRAMILSLFRIPSPTARGEGVSLLASGIGTRICLAPAKGVKGLGVCVMPYPCRALPCLQRVNPAWRSRPIPRTNFVSHPAVRFPAGYDPFFISAQPALLSVAKVMRRW